MGNQAGCAVHLGRDEERRSRGAPGGGRRCGWEVNGTFRSSTKEAGGGSTLLSFNLLFEFRCTVRSTTHQNSMGTGSGAAGMGVVHIRGNTPR